MDVARSTVHRILIRYGMSRLPVNQKRQPAARAWHRYEKPQPGHRLQIDVKFLERIAGSRKRLYQFTAIDDCTRIRVLKIYDVCNQKSAISFVDEVIRRLPFRVLVIQTDNGAEFQSNFHWHLEERDIRHVYIRPRTPRLNGKVERSHRVDEQEFYQLLDKNGIGDDIHLFNDKLREWEDYYNYHRPHGALDGQTPHRAAPGKENLGQRATEVLRPYTYEPRRDHRLFVAGFDTRRVHIELVHEWSVLDFACFLITPLGAQCVGQQPSGL